MSGNDLDGDLAFDKVVEKLVEVGGEMARYADARREAESERDQARRELAKVQSHRDSAVEESGNRACAIEAAVKLLKELRASFVSAKMWPGGVVLESEVQAVNDFIEKYDEIPF